MSVSVAMATYNGARFLEKQLDSIVSQTVPPSEIVICDDASSDGTASIVGEFAARSPVPIRFERNAVNLGYADNFFKAASLTTHPYIAFSDQDDIWRRDKIERSLAAIRDGGAVMAVHTATLIDAAGEPVGEMRRHIDGSRTVPPCTLEPWTMFWGFAQTFDRRLLDLLPHDRATRGSDSNAPENALGHDGWTSFLAGSFGKIALLDEPLVGYRQHSANVFGFQNRNFVGKIRAKMADEPSRVRRVAWLVDIALHRLTMLDAHAADDPRFVAPVAHWRRIHRHCAARRDLNTSKRALGRVGHLAVNLARGTYRHPSDGGLGVDRLMEDATLGLLGHLRFGAN
ncbi:glycosyltransferase [Lichenibacterium ramalinae]|nr:glycosyltransferase [Lichenibacterium ramalinae]